MFGFGMTEILLILAIALIVIGPQKLPEFGKTLGRALNEFKKGTQDFKRNLDIDTTLNDIQNVKNMAPTKTNLKKAIKKAVLKDDKETGTSGSTDSTQTDSRNIENSAESHEEAVFDKASDSLKAENNKNFDKSENKKEKINE